jgi:hypothetical protein
MFKKGMRVAMGVVGILSLACVAAAGDLMQWYPRTPAGGGAVGNLQVYLNQAAAVEYGPEAVVGRQLTGEARQGNVVNYSTSGTSSVYYLDENGNRVLYQETVQDQSSVQSQDSVIYYSK